jgi:SAM-dependent methyltransferase
MDRSVYQRIREIETDHWWFSGRRRIIGAVIQRLALPSSARILEVGCGTGGNIDLLRGFGAVRAAEPDRDAREYAAQRTGLLVDHGVLPDGLPYPEASFDLVCAFDVIEHVEDDAGAVAALSRLVDGGGVVLTTVPAYAWMWSRHDELHHHKRRYGLNEYCRLFERAGLTIERASYFNAALAPLAMLQRLAKRLLRSTSPDDVLPKPALNRMLGAVFSAERLWLAKADLPFGLSILVVARKAATASVQSGLSSGGGPAQAAA